MNILHRIQINAILLALFIFVPLSPGAVAQENTDSGATTTLPEALGPEAMQSLVSKLNPQQTEALIGLIQLLNESVSGEEVAQVVSQQGALELVQSWMTGFSDAVITHTINLPTALASMGKSIGAIFSGKTGGESLLFLVLLAVAIAVGVGAELLFQRATASRREKILNERPESLLGTLRTLSTRAALDIGGVIVFAVVAVVLLKILNSDLSDRFVATAFVFKAILVVRIVSALLRFTLAPHRTDLRLVSTDDWTAQFIYRGFVNLTAVIGAGLFLVAITGHFGYGDIETVRFWFSLVAHGWLIYITWKARTGLTAIIKGDEEVTTPGLERMAAWWPPICIGILAFNWLLIQFIVSTGNQTLTPGRGALAVFMIVILPFLDTIVRGVAGHLVPVMSGQGDTAKKAQHETRLCYVRVGRVILISAIVLFIGKLWGISFRNLAESGLGAQIASNAVGFLLILAVGYMAWEITNLVINRKLARELEASGVGGDDEGGEGGGAGLTRMATILPIFGMTLKVTIIIITTLLALSQLGVNITPLLAGAGVLGLAIGFGAQTLVKDIVSGVFFLLDDAFRAGEYVDVGGTEGTVEKISVRSLQLRGVTGPVHVVPYGSISKLTNMSRDWVIMKLKFTIPFDTDLEKVRKLFKKIGQEMMEVPELAEKFLSPFKGQGAADVTDVGIVVRGKFSTRPGDQWEIRKQVYNRVQKAFEANGIEFARKEVRVKMPEGVDSNNLTEGQKLVISTAVSEAAETPPKP